MPKGKRNRKNRRKRNQTLQDVQKSPQKSKEVTTHQTSDEDESTFLTLPNNTLNKFTPTSFTKSYKHKLNLTTRSHSVISATPRSAKKKATELHAVNLCKFFDDEIDTPKNENLNNVALKYEGNLRCTSPFSESYINNLSHCKDRLIMTQKRRGDCKMRSNSSMSKLRSPGLDNIPIMVDVATQTVYFNNSAEKSNFHNDSSDMYLQNCINIFETPKISQLEKLERAYNMQTPLSEFLGKNQDSLYDYFSPRVIQNDTKRSESNLEASIFSPQLMPSSTPIEKFHKSGKLFESIARNLLSAQLDRKILQKHGKLGRSMFNNSPKTPKNTNLYEGKLYTQKINKIENYIYKKRMYKSCSPRKVKDLVNKLNNSIIKTQTPKKDNSTVPKTFSPQRMSFSKTENILNVSNSNIYTRFKSNIKKLHNRYTSKWLVFVKEICSRIGITIRKKLTSICAPPVEMNESVPETSDITLRPRTCSDCKEYKQQIITLSTKIDHLSEELGKIKIELTELEVIKRKMAEIEENFKISPIMKCGINSPCVPPPPPPPPPPPLPPPLPLNLNLAPRVTKSVEKRTSGKISSENSRPVISLDDILNVKLKKTSDKSRIISRRSTQPFISVEMLSQIKLRPTTRSQTQTPSLKDYSTTSPASSLTKLLISDDTIKAKRLKRLGRTTRYSLDDSRRQFLSRERCGTLDY